MKLDELLNEIERIKGPFKKYPFCFPQYPDVDLLIESSFLLAQYVKRYRSAMEKSLLGLAYTTNRLGHGSPLSKYTNQHLIELEKALEWSPEGKEE